MLSKFTIKISIRVLLLFLIAMLVSFIPDYLHTFFGDTYCMGSGRFIKGETDWVDGYYENCNYAAWSYHDSMWHWGYRHWLFLVMGIILSIIQIADIINCAEKNNKS